MNEEKVLEALAQLNATMERGFSEMSGRFEAIESRLGKQEKTIKRTAKRQRLQASEIEQLEAVGQTGPGPQLRRRLGHSAGRSLSRLQAVRHRQGDRHEGAPGGRDHQAGA